MKYCAHCGRELADEAVICVGCGCPCPVAPVQNGAALVGQLASRVKTNGIIWICVAAVQIFLGLFFNWILLIVGALNLISAISDLKYASAVVQNPQGIVKRFEPLTGPIVVLIYNLLFGGLIGLIGSIYYLTAIRSFVLANKDVFSRYDAVQPNDRPAN